MPHQRKRHLDRLFLKTAAFSPLIGILGHRQVGKTTFLESKASSYVTMDDPDEAQKARVRPLKYLQELKGPGLVAIDECQTVTTLFPCFKEIVRKSKRPGQFALSGSVRFTSRKLIKESLTGRIANLELLPLGLAEIENEPLPKSLLRLLGLKDVHAALEWSTLDKALFERRKKKEQDYLTLGGLPGICFVRDSRMRNDRLNDQFETILDRDLRLVYETTLTYLTILDYVRALSLQEGQALNFSALQKKTGISIAVQKRLLSAFEAIFLIRLIPIEGDRSGLTVWFEDQAELRFASQKRAEALASFRSFVYRNLRLQFFYTAGVNFNFFQYRTKAGVVVPFALRCEEGVLGFLPVLESEPSRQDRAAALSFLSRYQNSKVIYITQGNRQSHCFSDRAIQVPSEWLLWE